MEKITTAKSHNFKVGDKFIPTDKIPSLQKGNYFVDRITSNSFTIVRLKWYQRILKYLFK